MGNLPDLPDFDDEELDALFNADGGDDEPEAKRAKQRQVMEQAFKRKHAGRAPDGVAGRTAPCSPSVGDGSQRRDRSRSPAAASVAGTQKHS